jgi:gelsolin
VPWPRNQYGQFYDGDSFIVLHTWQRPGSPKLNWDVYFWLGTFTTQDEAGTAAYKTVELDDKLGGAPVQHREVQGHESEGFLKLFNNQIRLLSGGVDTGFRAVKAETYEPRLFHLKGKRKIRVTQVVLSAKSLNSGDVFVLDTGLILYQWNGSQSAPMEKNRGAELTRAICDERAGKPSISVLEETMTGEDMDAFFGVLKGTKADVMSAEEGGDDSEVAVAATAKVLFQLSDETGQMVFSKVEGAISRDAFRSEDVFIFDTGSQIFAWIGKGASKEEKKNALGYAQDYLTRYNRPPFLPICRIFEVCISFFPPLFVRVPLFFPLGRGGGDQKFGRCFHSHSKFAFASKRTARTRPSRPLWVDIDPAPFFSVFNEQCWELLHFHRPCFDLPFFF